MNAEHPVPPIRAAVLTASDRCAGGTAEDRSGPAVAELLRSRLGAEIVHTRVLPDDLDALARCFAEWSRERPAIDLVVSTGGTGLAPRDVTPEAARRVIERDHSALLELARLRSLDRPGEPLASGCAGAGTAASRAAATGGGCGSSAARAYLSRGVAGAAGRTLIITLPGSPRGACEMLEAIVELLPHAISLLRGSLLDHGRSP